MIRRIFRKTKEDFPNLPKEVILSLAVHAVNSFAGPDGLTPSLLLFGHHPRIPVPNLLSLPLPQKERFAAMEVARKEMATITAQRRVAQALKSKGPAEPTHPYEFGDLVRVYRESTKRFEGPFSVHSFDNRKTVYVDVGTQHKPRIIPFTIASVKPYHPELEELGNDNSSDQSRIRNSEITERNSNESVLPETDLEALEKLTDQYNKMNSQDVPSAEIMNSLNPRQYQPNQIPTSILYGIEKAAKVFLASEEPYQKEYDNAVVLATITVKNPFDKRFEKAKEKEILQLLEKGTYKFVREKEVPKNATVLQSRFVLTIKNVGEKEELLKARLVIMGHIDPDKARVVKEAPTLLKSSIRLIIAFSAAHSFKLWTRDVPQAFDKEKTLCVVESTYVYHIKMKHLSILVLPKTLC